MSFGRPEYGYPYGYPYGKSYGYFMVIWGFGRTPVFQGFMVVFNNTTINLRGFNYFTPFPAFDFVVITNQRYFRRRRKTCTLGP